MTRSAAIILCEGLLSLALPLAWALHELRQLRRPIPPNDGPLPPPPAPPPPPTPTEKTRARELELA